MAEPPTVSGVSPREGFPGTKVTIRGENLGNSKGDVIGLTIGSVSCVASLEYVSAKKLVCLSGTAVGKCQIIVQTSSGGEGTCTVVFNGLVPERPPLLDPEVESDEWKDEAFAPLPFMKQEAKAAQIPIYARKVTDPLGGASDKSSRKGGQPSDQLSALFPNGGSSNIQAEDFNSIWYLIEVHRNTSFANVKSGLRNLRSLIQDESKSVGGSITDATEQHLANCKKFADKMFADVLSYKARADAMRNALTILQRYRFLFSLPRTIEVNIKKEDYDVVTNDYYRAKSLFSGTKVKVFTKVLEEVQKQVKSLRDDLKKKLQVLPTTLDNQKKIIKYLMDLDYEGDAAWECICNMHQWLLKRLFNTKTDYQKGHIVSSSGDQTPLPHDEIIPPSRGHARTMSDLSFLSGTGSTGRDKANLRPPKDLDADSCPPRRILFIKEITSFLMERLPDFCKLDQAYYTGSLFQGVSSLDEKRQKESCEANHPKFESMIMEIVETYTDMVNCSLYVNAYDQLSKGRKERLGDWVPFDENLLEKCGAWLPQTIREIRKCVSSLQGLPLPSQVIDMSQELAHNVRELCSDTLFIRASNDIRALPEREDWQVHAEEGGTITSLPVLFENLVVEILLSLKEVIVESLPGEPKISDTLLGQSLERFHDLLEDFTVCINTLAFKDRSDEKTVKIRVVL
ncbi:hypothetical protein EMCRGX_G029713 [Ephydatia muelleri]